jgi:hypothetical protein
VNSLANFQNPQYNTAVQNLQNLQTEAASAQAGTENVAGGAPITASDQAGQAGILNRLYASKIQAAQTGVSNTLQAGQQQLSGLQSAQGALQPQLSQYGNTYYFPGSATGNATQTGGAGVSTSDPFYATLQSYAQMAANGQYSAIPSSITGNSVLNAQMNQMAKQINQNYNPITSQAQSGITASQAGNVATMTASYKSATNLGNQLKDLITTFGINPADINSVNSGIQKIAQNVSSPQYKALFNLVTDIVSTYSSILTPGSTSNQAQDKAASLLDASAKGSSIMETLNNLDEQAKAKIAGQTTSYGENPGNTNSSGSTSSTGNSWNDIFGNQ